MKRRSYIKSSEVLARIKEIKDEYGDIPVKICLPGLPKKPEISGIRIVKGDSGHSSPNIDIIPKYDINGFLAEASSVNTVAYEIATTQSMFRRFATDILALKKMLEDYKVANKQVIFNGKSVDLVPLIKDNFNNLLKYAQKIQPLVKSLAGFDKRMKEVIDEPFKTEDYASSYSHSIDINMTDAEFAKSIADGIGEKTSVQRLASYVDIMRKINKEIESRKQRIAQLEKRIKAEKATNEGMNAQILKNKAQGIIDTLQKRRDYILKRFMMLKKSIFANVATLEDEIVDLANA